MLAKSYSHDVVSLGMGLYMWKPEIRLYKVSYELVSLGFLKQKKNSMKFQAEALKADNRKI